MSYVRMYIEEKDKKLDIIASLNHIRLHKKMILLCKLVGIKGTSKIRELRNPLESGCFKQRITFLILPKPSKKSLQLQIECTEWLLTKEVQTVYDFDKRITYRYQISVDKTYLRERKDDVYEYYEK